MAIQNGTIRIARRGGSTVSPRRFAAVAIGGGLPTDPDIAGETAIVGDYLAAMGVV